MFLVRQHVRGPRVDDVAASVLEGLRSLEVAVQPGQTVAITGGSRGITDAVTAIRTVASFMRELGASPFLVPAMGSHGGGTAEGQRAVLESYGMTEAAIGCPIRASMDVVEVGRSKLGFPIWQDRLARQADHLVVINRVKPHTLFTGRFESGLVKMLMIGLGKAAGAAAIHQAVMEYGWEAVVDDVAPTLLEQDNVLAGIALVERSDDATARVAVLPPPRWLTDEPVLLDEAREIMPRLPFIDIDLLLLDRIGKNISGAGLDTNVVARKDVLHPPTFEAHKRIKFIAARGLTPESHGNAIGVGLVEFCRSRVLREMDVAATRLNSLTAGDMVAAMLPFDYETDREIIDTAMPMIGLRAPSDARILWARDTLHLDEVVCSAPLLDEAAVRDDLDVVGEPFELPFDANGNLPDDMRDALRS